MTNSRSLSWIDRGRWESLLSAATDPSTAHPETARSPRPAGAAPARPPAPRHAAPVPAVSPVTAVAAAPAKRSYPPYACEASHLDERLQALIAWIEANATCTAAFVADDNGLPVVEHVGAEQTHIAAASSILMMLASVRSLMRDSGGWLTLKMAESVLHVVEVTTRWGRFAIGVVSDDLLPHEFLSALSAAVESAFHGETSQGEST
jgi:hypothetical protein